MPPRHSCPFRRARVAAALEGVRYAAHVVGREHDGPSRERALDALAEAMQDALRAGLGPHARPAAALLSAAIRRLAEADRPSSN